MRDPIVEQILFDLRLAVRLEGAAGVTRPRVYR
jgi:hypothetical protein